MKAVEVVQVTVPGFSDDGQGPWLSESTVLQAPGDHRVAHHANTMRIGDGHRTVKKAGFLDPRGACHLAVAVQAEPSRVDGVDVLRAAGQDDCDAGANGTFADFQRPITADQRSRADLDAGYIGDRIELPR